MLHGSSQGVNATRRYRDVRLSTRALEKKHSAGGRREKRQLRQDSALYGYRSSDGPEKSRYNN